jgi:hypothetical protein
LFAFLAYSFALKMEPVRSSETSVYLYQTTRRHIRDLSTFLSHCLGNRKSNRVKMTRNDQLDLSVSTRLHGVMPLFGSCVLPLECETECQEKHAEHNSVVREREDVSKRRKLGVIVINRTDGELIRKSLGTSWP